MPYEKISRKIDFIISKLTYLRENKPLNLTEFKTDETRQMAILYAIHVATEALIDIVLIIQSKRNGNTHMGDYETITALFESGFIEEDAYESLRKLNGLRNAIVHAYDSLQYFKNPCFFHHFPTSFA
ncbi:DUF86 domain-containing protein [Methanogenium sp. MK-MG]|uniref:type VII toxin-antitoxin system HepT family RNase toxin n=1 Tax=Methanogenium sp. MK-MG TaxID=2599926 RepID=UPI0013EE137B|nr:HepT-like ribonuclease domain-containing protein [Methanogenium sp. MK-MG]KAF1073303.1 hypothetical protein MKMG_02207 [Methanogenium sp. MK-MG]